MPPRSRFQLAVIGDPVSHSLSPEMQNAALKKLKLPLRYGAIRVRPQELKSFVKGLGRRLMGFNVTIPHKVAIVPLLDRIAFEAKLIGAVNTVLSRNGFLVGFNTDGAGYLMSLLNDAKFQPRGKQVTLLGAGGAARAIGTALGLNQVRSLTIANRTQENAARLTKDLIRNLPKISIHSCGLTGKAFASALKNSHLLINTTSIGLHATAFPDFPWKSLKKGALVSDIVYHPRMTPFLKAAKKYSHPIHSGEGMLVHQGALALEIWTGMKPDTRLMRRVLLKNL